MNELISHLKERDHEDMKVRLKKTYKRIKKNHLYQQITPYFRPCKNDVVRLQGNIGNPNYKSWV